MTQNQSSLGKSQETDLLKEFVNKLNVETLSDLVDKVKVKYSIEKVEGK